MAEQSKPIIYRAPLCREPGCNRHVWSIYCPDHRDSKLAELEGRDSSALSLTDKKLLDEFSHRETAATRRIGERVQRILPEMFETAPTADEMEAAADRYVYMANFSELMRQKATIESQGRGTSPEEVLDVAEPVFYEQDADDQSVSEAASRLDLVGPTPSSARLVSSYLYDGAREARLSRGDETDGADIPLDLDQSEYIDQRFGACAYLSDEEMQHMEADSAEAAEQYKSVLMQRRQHDREVASGMDEARRQFGDARMGGYDDTPTQVVSEQRKSAWSEMPTTQFTPVSEQPARSSGAEEDISETKEFRPIPPDSKLAHMVAQSDPTPGQPRRTPKFVNATTGIVYDQNMEPIGSIHSPEMQRTRAAQKRQNEQRDAQQQRIPEGMVRQRDNRPASPEQHWQQAQRQSAPMDDGPAESVPAPRRRGLMRSVGRGIAKTAGFGWDVGMSFREAKQDVDDRNMGRLAAYRQDEANRSIIDMGKRNRGGWL